MLLDEARGLTLLRMTLRSLPGMALACCLLVASADAALGAAPSAAFKPATTRGSQGTPGVDAPSERFGWPVTPHHVVRRFQRPAQVWGPGHRGVDLQTRAHADVVAPADGEVTFSGVVAGRGVLSVRHPQGFSTTYEPVSDQLPRGAQVHRGQRMARLEDGHCGPGTSCLHWGYRVAKGDYRDPLTLIRPRRPVLLPLLPGV